MKTIFAILCLCASFTTTIMGQTFQWAIKMGLTGSATAKGTVTDGAGYIYTTGYFYGTVDFDPGPATNSLFSTSGSYDIFVTKHDANGNYVWAKKMGGTQSDEGNAITLDASGNIYITGSFEGTANFDQSPNVASLTSAGATDIFVVRLDNNGFLYMVSRMGGVGSDEGTAIANNGSNTTYVTGYFNDTFGANTAQGPVTLTSAGGADIFVASYVSASLAWVKQIGGTGDDEGNGITMNSLGQIISTGSFENTVDFNPGAQVENLNSNGLSDIFVLKLSNTGVYQWAKNMGGTSDDIGLGITRDNNNNIYTTGSFRGTSDFNPAATIENLISNGANDIFISKLDDNGNFIWARSMGGSSADVGYSIKLDALNNVYTVGTFSSTCDFDPSTGIYPLVSAGSNDIFMQKLDASGNFVWSKRAGGPGSDNAYSAAVPSNSIIYTVGSFTNTVDFDPGPNVFDLIASGGPNAFILKINSCGSGYSTSSYTACDSVSINGTNYTSTGYFTQLFNDMSGCDSNVVYNVTIHPSYNLNLIYSVCDSITIGNQTYTSSGIYTQNLTSMWGCDSNLTINVTVNSPNSNSISITACDTLNLNGQGYNTSGTYVQTLTNVAGCDSLLTLNLIIKNSSATVINDTSCYSYLLNGQTYNSTGVYTQSFTNAVGCDSIITLNLTINDTTTAITNQTACSSFLLNGQTYNTSGVYTQTLVNANGCDSILTLNLIVNQPSTHTITHTACKSFTLNGQVYNTSGVYTQTLVNAAGCDSILTLNLTVNNANTSVTQSWAGLTSNATSAIYQWLRCNPFQNISGEVNQTFTPGAIGYYAVAVTENGCTDTSACYTVNAVGINDQVQSSTISLYPNPVTQTLFIESNHNFENASVKILSIAGQKVLEKISVSGKKIEVEMMSLQAGTYFIEIVDNKNRYVKMISKN